VLRFFSKKEWVIRPRADGPPPSEIAWLAPTWESAAASASAGEDVGEGADATGWGPFQSSAAD
jgi:hypothetical protein